MEGWKPVVGVATGVAEVWSSGAALQARRLGGYEMLETRCRRVNVEAWGLLSS